MAILRNPRIPPRQTTAKAESKDQGKRDPSGPQGEHKIRRKRVPQTLALRSPSRTSLRDDLPENLGARGQKVRILLSSLQDGQVSVALLARKGALAPGALEAGGVDCRAAKAETP